MEHGQLFRLGKSPDVFRAEVSTVKDCCNGCYAIGKPALCKRMPFCIKSEDEALSFKRLNSHELRQAIKAKTPIQRI